MIALERLRHITGRASGTTGAALRRLAMSGGLAGVLLASYSSLAQGTAQQHLLSPGHSVANIAANLLAQPGARQWVTGQAVRVFDATARPRPLCATANYRAWVVSKTPKWFAVNPHKRHFYAQSVARHWSAQDAIRLLYVAPLGRGWGAQQPPRSLAFVGQTRIFKIST